VAAHKAARKRGICRISLHAHRPSRSVRQHSFLPLDIRPPPWRRWWTAKCENTFFRSDHVVKNLRFPNNFLKRTPKTPSSIVRGRTFCQLSRVSSFWDPRVFTIRARGNTRRRSREDTSPWLSTEELWVFRRGRGGGRCSQRRTEGAGWGSGHPRSPDSRNDPGTVTIPQYWFNRTKEHTHRSRRAPVEPEVHRSQRWLKINMWRQPDQAWCSPQTNQGWLKGPVQLKKVDQKSFLDKKIRVNSGVMRVMCGGSGLKFLRLPRAHRLFPTGGCLITNFSPSLPETRVSPDPPLLHNMGYRVPLCVY